MKNGGVVRRWVIAAGLSVALAAQAGASFAAPVPRSSWDPSAPPARLTDFAATINKSMVTVYCGNGLGSGWASNVSINADAVAAGYKSYVITNHHVIQQCTYANTRYIEVRQGGIRYPAYVWSWDAENDLAGLHTTADLPKLEWFRVPRPLPGQWVAAFGSPYGLAGSITTGIVSYVGDAELTSTAPINPGNSGGPLVDNKGRVLGVNTGSIDGSNGFGIVMGTPLFCTRIVNCNNAADVWTDGEPAAANLLGERSGQDARFSLASVGLAGETATLFLRRVGEVEYSPTQTQQVPDSGFAYFTVSDPGKLYAYVAVGSLVTNRVIIPQAEVVPEKLTYVTASAKGNGTVLLSWAVPSWATPTMRPWYQYRVNGGAWKTLRKTSVQVTGLRPGLTVKFDVRGSVGDPRAGGTVGPSSTVSARVR